MSIPLDRLYHFLEDQIKDDILIYRWYPHGSKKIADLGLWRDITFDWFDSMTLPIAIMNDQEPLNFEFYQDCQVVSPYGLSKSPLVEPLISAMPVFRQVLGIPLNINDQLILVHSERNSQQVALYRQHNFVPVYYWSHAIIALDWFRYAKHDLQLDFNNLNFKHDFLIYNRAWSGTREYRLKFCELLVQNQLLQSCQTSFAEFDNGLHYLDYACNNPQFKVSSDLHQLMHANTSLPTASADYVSEDYQSCGIEVVLETLFDDSRCHYTEKLLRPIACGKPFIVVGTPGALTYLRSYGFETFNGLIDETYDEVTNPVVRLQRVITEMQRIADLPYRAKQDFYRELHHVAQKNKQRFFSPDFFNQVVSEFSNNMTQALSQCLESRCGQWLKMFYKILDQNIEFKQQLAKNTPATAEQVAAVKSLIGLA